MKISSSYSSAGRVIYIETDEELDLTSHGVFVDACRLAEYPDCSSIDVNLIKTRNIRASGVAMLLMLRQLTGCACNRIRLLNCHPNVRNYLMKSKLGQQFQVVLSRRLLSGYGSIQLNDQSDVRSAYLI